MSAQISCFVDTNVLLYLMDAGNPAKRERARKWLEALSGRQAVVISPQSVNEFCNVILSRWRHVTREELLAAVSNLRLWCTAQTVYENALEALDLQQQMYVSYYDAVLLSSALAAGCTHFLSEDFQAGRTVAGMKIVNPFETEPETVLDRM